MHRLDKPITDFAPWIRTSSHMNALAWVFGQKQIIMPQPPYSSPDLVAADFLLFPKLKTPMKGKCFAAIEKIKEKSKQKLLGDTKKGISEVFRGLQKTLAYIHNRPLLSFRQDYWPSFSHYLCCVSLIWYISGGLTV